MIYQKIVLFAVCLFAIAPFSLGFSDENDDGDLRIPEVYGDYDPYGMDDMSDNPHGGPSATPLGSLEDIDEFVQVSLILCGETILDLIERIGGPTQPIHHWLLR